MWGYPNRIGMSGVGTHPPSAGMSGGGTQSLYLGPVILQDRIDKLDVRILLACFLVDNCFDV